MVLSDSVGIGDDFRHVQHAEKVLSNLLAADRYLFVVNEQLSDELGFEYRGIVWPWFRRPDYEIEAEPQLVLESFFVDRKFNWSYLIRLDGIKATMG